jgi:competence protein ComEC
VLLPLLQALHTRLDTVLLSHRDTDHVGGAAAVLAMQPQAVLLSSVAIDDRLQTRRTVPRAQRCLAGQHWAWDGVQFDILHPQAADYDKPHTPNAVSCVLRIQSAGAAQRATLAVWRATALDERLVYTLWLACRTRTGRSCDRCGRPLAGGLLPG